MTYSCRGLPTVTRAPKHPLNEMTSVENQITGQGTELRLPSGTCFLLSLQVYNERIQVQALCETLLWPWPAVGDSGP